MNELLIKAILTTTLVTNTFIEWPAGDTNSTTRTAVTEVRRISKLKLSCYTNDPVVVSNIVASRVTTKQTLGWTTNLFSGGTTNGLR